MRWAPVARSLNVGALSCVSIIAQSHIIEKVYLISWLYKLLRNCFCNEPNFRVSYFQVSTF